MTNGGGDSAILLMNPRLYQMKWMECCSKSHGTLESQIMVYLDVDHDGQKRQLVDVISDHGDVENSIQNKV